jgi:hypothetical protein
MLRRIFLFVASAAMLALTALPASAATTHKLYFPGLHGVKAWGTYVKTSKGIKIHVCADDTVRGIFATGAVVVTSNSTRTLHSNGGAVAIGYHQAVCRNVTLRYTAHMQIYTFTANNHGQINHRSKTKNVF